MPGYALLSIGYRELLPDHSWRSYTLNGIRALNRAKIGQTASDGHSPIPFNALSVHLSTLCM